MYRLKLTWMVIAGAMAGSVAAQSHVHRCRDANGHWVFQGQPCGEGLNEPQARSDDPVRHLSGRRDDPVPARCESAPQRFVFADPAVDGALFDLVLIRDASGYQVVLNLGGVIERDDGVVPAQFSAHLGAQGLRFDQGELIAPDFRRGDKQLGYGYARSAMLLNLASKALSIDAEIEPEGYAQSLWSAPMAASVLTALRTEMLRCHLRRERGASKDAVAPDAKPLGE